MTDSAHSHPSLGPRPVIRRRASAFRDAQRAGRARRRLLRIAAVALVVVAIGSVTAGAVVALGFSSLPNADSILAQPLPSDTLVYDRTGRVLLADLHPSGSQHQQAALSEMGRYLPAATVAVEDANFWQEGGVDPLSIGRAVFADLRHRAAVQGGSTITQQLVKLRLVGATTSYSRKLREAALAVRIAGAFSRSQILEMYLNDISYGNTAYGAATAAHVYFHRSPAQLDLAQAALLAGLPQNPTLLDPFRNWDGAKQRQRVVLDAMVRAHDITATDAGTAFAEDLSPPAHLFGPETVNVVPRFMDYVSAELKDRLGAGVVRNGGLRVVTTLDMSLQQLGQQAVTRTVEENQFRSVTDGALVSIDPRTGQIVAMVGSAGPNAPGGEYNMAAIPRNPGSSFKIFTYSAAIESRHYTMVTPVRDVPLTVLQPTEPGQPAQKAFSPKNYDLQYHGTCQLQACLGNSLNVPAVEVELGTGIPAVVDMARRLGAGPLQGHNGTYTSTDDPASFGASLTLGGYAETPLKMAAGASALATGGVLHPPEAVLSTSSAGGRELYRASDAGRRVLDAGTAYIVGQMLSDDANRSMAFGRGTPLVLEGRRAAAKTGTTDDFRDGWTVGYTPSLATAVWMGNTDNHPMQKGTDGIYVATPAWHAFMRDALDRLHRGDEWYDVPPGVDTQYFGGRRAYFLSGTSPATQPPALPSWAHLGSGTNGASGPTCRAWVDQGRSYWACTAGDSGLPGDPGPPSDAARSGGN
jgi:membrane peptidoglycan carboxypeptidase